jgi:hypothetical protein
MKAFAIRPFAPSALGPSVFGTLLARKRSSGASGRASQT